MKFDPTCRNYYLGIVFVGDFFTDSMGFITKNAVPDLMMMPIFPQTSKMGRCV